MTKAPGQGGYASPDEWRAAAMARPDGVDARVQRRRRRWAARHNAEHGVCEPDALADQELYIRGKMSREEYEAYLVFKHAPARGRS